MCGLTTQSFPVALFECACHVFQSFADVVFLFHGLTGFSVLRGSFGDSCSALRRRFFNDDCYK